MRNRSLLRTGRQPALALVTALLAGCAMGPDYRAPKLALPDEWPEHVMLSAGARQEWQSWWTRFEDPSLDWLVERAVDDNLDIRLQLARIEEARAPTATATLFKALGGGWEADA
ncbi:hypothetical protein [Halomonas alkalisoli]|uniref:hypothetical protein n=1 Tax=Halomonas alkalisoli TaxID=2907158 RepID=UPI001F1D7809|nr:hypothetical protein [Halomonas alkalisoli]MCE9683375.1 hypothetical protein [Halomonas alkalisoli]